MPKLIEPIRRWLRSRPKTAPHISDYVPSEIADTRVPAKPEAGYYHYVLIEGQERSPDGQDLGAYALANGKSGDINRFPLPTDPENPKSVFIENGTAGMLKSIGQDSMVVEVPGSGIWHLRREDVRDMKGPEERDSPVQRWMKPTTEPLTPPMEVHPDMAPLVEDLYDPKMPPRSGALRMRAEGLVHLYGYDDDIAFAIAQHVRRELRASGFTKKRSTVSSIRQKHLTAAAQYIQNTWQHPRLEDFTGGQQILRVPDADAVFQKTRIYLLVQSPNQSTHLAGAVPDLLNPFIAIYVLPLLTQFTPGYGLPDQTGIQDAAQRLVAHELRHIARFLYEDEARKKSSDPQAENKDAKEFSEYQRLHGQKPVLEVEPYINLPTELLSWAGDVANGLWLEYGTEYKSFSGAQLAEMTFTALHGMTQHVRPENRRLFLRRVMQELHRKEQALNTPTPAPTSAPAPTPTTTPTP